MVWKFTFMVKASVEEKCSFYDGPYTVSTLLSVGLSNSLYRNFTFYALSIWMKGRIMRMRSYG